MRNRLEQALDTLTSSANQVTMLDRLIAHSKKWPDTELTYNHHGRILKIKNGKVL